MEPRPNNSKFPRDVIFPIRAAMEHHSRGPEGFINMIELNPANSHIVKTLSSATELLKTGNNEQNLKRCFFNGALFGIMIAKSVLTDEEIHKLPEIIKSIVADCEDRAKNETRELQARSDNLVGISNLGLFEAGDYVLEIVLIKDKISPLGSVNGDAFSMLGASFMLHVIEETKKEVWIEKEIRSAKLTIDGIEDTMKMARTSANTLYCIKD